MLTEPETEKRLNELQAQLRAKSSDTLDPELKARISELELVLELPKVRRRGYTTGAGEEWR
jgi:hypothetical protein